MVHTMMISCRITRVMHSRILKVLRIKDRNRIASTTCYSPLGLREITLMRSTGAFKYIAMYIRINPAVLIGQENSIGTVSASDINAVENAFDQLITKIFPEGIDIPALSDWQVKRVDFACDIKTENVESYLLLFKKGDKAGASFNNSYDSTGSYYKKSKSVGINFYDKRDQLVKKIEQGSTTVTDRDISDAENVLRLEVQCELSKINAIKNKYNLARRDVRYMLNATIAKEIILYYFDKAIGSGDYYKAYHAYKDIMENNSLSKRSKDNCIDTVKLVAQARSVWKAREQYDAGITIKNSQPPLKLKGSKAAFNEHLKIIRKIGVNPVTIPKEWKINYLPNIRTQMEQQLI
jgi:hypothetical protein